jgi:hypothetical protein
MKDYTLAQKLVIIIMLEFCTPTLQPNPAAPSRECYCPLPFGITNRREHFVGFTFQEAIAVLNNVDTLLWYPVKHRASVIKHTILFGLYGRGDVAPPGATCYRLTQEKPAALSAKLWNQLVFLYDSILISSSSDVEMRFRCMFRPEDPTENAKEEPGLYPKGEHPDPEKLVQWACNGTHENGETLCQRFGRLVWRLVFHPKQEKHDEIGCMQCAHDLPTRIRLERQEKFASGSTVDDDLCGDVAEIIESGLALFRSAGLRPPKTALFTGATIVGNFGSLIFTNGNGPSQLELGQILNRAAEKRTAMAEAAAVAAGCRPMPPKQVTSVRPSKASIRASKWAGEFVKKAEKLELMTNQFRALMASCEMFKDSGLEMLDDRTTNSGGTGFVDTVHDTGIEDHTTRSGVKVGGMNRREARNLARQTKKAQKKKPVVITERRKVENALLAPVEETTVVQPPAEM